MPNVDHCAGMAGAPITLVDLTMRPVPHEVVPPAGPASVPQRVHEPNAGPQVKNVGFLAGLARGDAGSAVPAHSSPGPGDTPEPVPGRVDVAGVPTPLGAPVN